MIVKEMGIEGEEREWESENEKMVCIEEMKMMGI